MLFLETHQFARPYGRVLVLIYPTFTVPFWTWLLMGFFKSLPKEVEESAMVDGCSRVAAIWRMVLPPVALVRGDRRTYTFFLDRFIAGFTVGAIK